MEKQYQQHLEERHLKKNEYYSNANICWVKSKELKRSYIASTEEHINTLALTKSSSKILPAHSVLIAMYGATVVAYGIISTQMTYNQAIYALIENNEYPYTYLYQFVCEIHDEIVNLAVGSAQQNIIQVLIKNILLHSIFFAIQKFHDFSKQIHNVLEKIDSENRILENIRDTLLPSLMSGDIDVSNIDAAGLCAYRGV